MASASTKICFFFCLIVKPVVTFYVDTTLCILQLHRAFAYCFGFMAVLAPLFPAAGCCFQRTRSAKSTVHHLPSTN